MFRKPCRCGKTKKNFKIDIGEFFINECCEAEGFNQYGLKGDEKPAPPELEEVEDIFKSSDEEPTEAPKSRTEEEAAEAGRKIAVRKATKFVENTPKSKIKDLKVADLKALASDLQIEGAEKMTKKKLLEAILG